MALSRETAGGSNYNGIRKISHRRMPKWTRMVELYSKHLSITYRDKKKEPSIGLRGRTLYS